MTRSLIVDEVRDETQKIRVLTLRGQDMASLPAYTAGAHIDFDLEEHGIRSYSLIDWPDPKSLKATYTIAVQREEGGQGGSKAMHDLVSGQIVQTSEPINDFELKAANGPTLLLAGGIGITPLISMATELKGRGKPFQLHYAGRSEGVMAFAETLRSTFSDQVTLHFDDQTPLDLGKLMASQQSDCQVYICGPRGMIDAARTAAVSAGIAEDNIHIELFAAPDAEARDEAFEVEIHSSGEVFTIPAGRSIIEVLEEAGKDLMFDCQRGDCGICQTDVISGIPDHRDVVLSEADRASGNVMQICVSRAKSGRLVLDL